MKPSDIKPMVMKVIPRPCRPAGTSLYLSFSRIPASSAIASAQEAPALSSGQTLYQPIYSHVTFGNLGRSGAPSQVMLSALVSIRSTDPRRPLRVVSARYYDTNGKLLGERVPNPVTIPPLGTLELFIERNDFSGGSGANFVIKWDASAPVNPPMVEALHVNMDGGKAASS